MIIRICRPTVTPKKDKTEVSIDYCKKSTTQKLSTMIVYKPYNCKSILNKSTPTAEDPFIGTVNPYIGCEHGCKYCYVQAEKYLPYEHIDEFSYTVKVKQNAPSLLNSVLQNLNFGLICLGSSSDPYQPVEKKYKVTRKLLKVISHYSYPIHIFTKSHLILKDLDLLKEISKKTFSAVSFSIITLNKKTIPIFEPKATIPEFRIKAMYILSKNGINTGAAIMPVLPYITDKRGELEELIKTVKDNGAKYIWGGSLTLRDIQANRYRQILSRYFPDLINKYNILYKNRNSPTKGYCEILNTTFNELAQKYKISIGPASQLPENFLPVQLEFKFNKVQLKN
ncbi:MAG: radical SAM protein [Elusimicrobiota bacterium]|nr:radical SAM protein [Elusimicrobiota bacterium]